MNIIKIRPLYYDSVSLSGIVPNFLSFLRYCLAPCGLLANSSSMALYTFSFFLGAGIGIGSEQGVSGNWMTIGWVG